MLIQFNASRAAMPVLQDAGGDCIALADFGGSGGSARLVAQWTYDPYGQVITHEHLVASHAFLRAGHKGLFVDRLDAGVLTGGNETPRLAEGAELLAHNRNRTLKPDLGRYVQMDPNATALVVVASSAHGGGTMIAEVSRFDLESLYGDGANVYAYLGSNPWIRLDPLGLSWDPFAWHVDAFLAEDAGNKAAFMEDLVQSFDTTMHIVAQVSQLHPGVAMAVTAYKIATGAPITSVDLLTLIPGLGRAGNIIGHSFSSFWKGRKAMRNARRAGYYVDDALELHHVIPQFMTGWTRGTSVVLTRAQHQQYHRILDDVLRANRMPTKNQGTDAWRTWIQNNPGGGDRARGALVESVELFKLETGIDMMGDLWVAFTRQGWLLR